VLNISILQNNKVFIFSILATLIGYAAVFAVSFLLSLYLQYIKGLTPEQAGLVMLAQPVMQAALSPYTGRLSDKIEPRIVASAGMALTCAALLSFIFLTGNTSLMQIIIILVALGVGIALFSSPNANAIMNSVVPKFYGVASAALNTTISIGQMLSMGITMMVIAIIVGRVVITSEYYLAFLTSAKVIFGVLTILCFAGIFT
jgi:MFS family permease